MGLLSRLRSKISFAAQYEEFTTKLLMLGFRRKYASTGALQKTTIYTLHRSGVSDLLCPYIAVYPTRSYGLGAYSVMLTDYTSITSPDTRLFYTQHGAINYITGVLQAWSDTKRRENGQ